MVVAVTGKSNVLLIQNPARKHPGEPLYTLEELCRKGAINGPSIPALTNIYPGLRPWVAGYRGHPAMYRKSDFASWWRSLPQASRDKAKLKKDPAP